MHEFIKFDVAWRIWDMSGNGRARSLWKHYLKKMDAIAFVVDSFDISRLKTAKSEFFKVIHYLESINYYPVIIVFLNKNDIPEISEDTGKIQCINNEAFYELFQLDCVKEKCTIRLQSCSALLGNGIDEGLEWVVRNSR